MQTKRRQMGEILTPPPFTGRLQIRDQRNLNHTTRYGETEMEKTGSGGYEKEAGQQVESVKSNGTVLGILQQIYIFV